jgi:hypothetical protein
MARHWSVFVPGVTGRQARALDTMAEARHLGDGMALLQEVTGASRSGVGRIDRLTMAGHVDECFRRWGRDAPALPVSGTVIIGTTTAPASAPAPADLVEAVMRRAEGKRIGADARDGELRIDAADLRAILAAELAGAALPGPSSLVDEWTRRLWATSQNGRMVINLAGEIQDVVGKMRSAAGLPELLPAAEGQAANCRKCRLPITMLGGDWTCTEGPMYGTTNCGADLSAPYTPHEPA